jgi:hypothetical protein
LYPEILKMTHYFKAGATILFLVIFLHYGKSQATVLVKNPDSSLKVKPVNWSRFQKKAPGDKLANTVKATLLNANRYALTTWYHTIKNYKQIRLVILI